MACSFYRYYIRGDYHCDSCPFSWEERGLEDADAGCYIKGDLMDTCRLLPPLRFLIGWGKRKKAIYCREHEYDDFGEWYEEKLRKEQEMGELLERYFPSRDVSAAIRDGFSDKAEDIYAPVKYVPVGKRWKSLIRETWNCVLEAFKPYFCK